MKSLAIVACAGFVEVCRSVSTASKQQLDWQNLEMIQLASGFGTLISKHTNQKLGGLVEDLGALVEDVNNLEGPNTLEDSSQKICQAGFVPVPKMEELKLFTANGCGPQGMQIKEEFGLYKCCNGHDVCFEVCGTTHKFCEEKFSSCMAQVCETPLNGTKEECLAQSKSFSVLTRSFGQSFHLESQKESCDCLPGDQAAERQLKFLQSFYNKYDGTKSLEEVKRQLSKWSGREGEMFYQLVRKYGQAVVKFDHIQPEFFIEKEGTTFMRGSLQKL
jgi:secretory phospholipase A2